MTRGRTSPIFLYKQIRKPEIEIEEQAEIAAEAVAAKEADDAAVAGDAEGGGANWSTDWSPGQDV